MKPFEMALPKTVPDAVEALGDEFSDNALLAGGTDLLGQIKDRIQFPDRVVNLKTVPGLNEIKITDSGAEIGALVSLTEIAEHDELHRQWPALRTTIMRTATPQIRNVGTLGGNLCQRVRCWYFRHDEYPCLKKGGQICYAQQGENEIHSIFDNRVCCAPHPSNTAPVLVAYDARVEIHGPKGTRSMPLEEFFTRPSEDVTKENVLGHNEIVTKVTLDRASASRHSAYVDTREKQSFDWSLCGATVNLRIDGDQVKQARVVLSAVGPRPERRKDLEALLVDQSVAGGNVADDLLDKVAKQSVRGARPLEQNKFKLALVKANIKRAIRRAAKG